MLKVSNPCESARPSEVGGLAASSEAPQSTHEIPLPESVAKTTSVFSKFIHLVSTPARFVTNLFSRVQPEKPDVSVEAQAPQVLQTDDERPILLPTPMRSAPIDIDEDQEKAPLPEEDKRPAEEPPSPAQQPQCLPLIAETHSPLTFESSLHTGEKLDATLEQAAEEPCTPSQQAPQAAPSDNVATPPVEEDTSLHYQAVVATPSSGEESGYITEDTVVEEEDSQPLDKAPSVTEGLGEAPAEPQIPEEPSEIATPVLESPANLQIRSDVSSPVEQAESAPERAIEAPKVSPQELRSHTSTPKRKKRRSWNNALPTPPLRVCQQGMLRRKVYKFN